VRQVSNRSIPLQVKLLDKKGMVIGKDSFAIVSKEWTKYTAIITAAQNEDSASLEIIAKGKGKLASLHSTTARTPSSKFQRKYPKCCLKKI